MKREYPASHAKLNDEEKKEVKVHEWSFVEIHTDAALGSYLKKSLVRLAR